MYAAPAFAANCSDYPGGVLDGATGATAPAQLNIDRDCTIRNFPDSSPLPTDFSFLTQPDPAVERWLVTLDNVAHTGEMVCDGINGYWIWLTNGSSASIEENCEDLLVPVEKIRKEKPAGTSYAEVGVPYTYTLTLPVLYSSWDDSVINESGSLSKLHNVSITDDLNATGADMAYVSHTAYWQDGGAPVTHNFSDDNGLLTFDNLPEIPAGEQIVIELTVVLEDVPTNAPGIIFSNTAKWEFGRKIKTIHFEPLPGEWGVSQPMGVRGPDLAMTKSGPETLNLLEAGEFTLDVRNIGKGDAWNATLTDRLPQGTDGGMCDTPPVISSVQVFSSDGVTPAAGKGPLSEGVGYSAAFTGAPACELTLTVLSDEGMVASGERLIVVYDALLDEDTGDDVDLTNVAGATQWFNADKSFEDRRRYTRTLSNGTPGAYDHEDDHTVTSDVSGLLFEKTVANLTTGEILANTAAPGDRLRYNLRIRTTDTRIKDGKIYDDLGALNASAVFVPGSLELMAATVPEGADAGNTNPTGGTNAAGVVDIRDLTVDPWSEIAVQFEVTVSDAVPDATIVLNQAQLDHKDDITDSDDPTINGPSLPDVQGDEDPTRIVIQAKPAAPPLKANTQSTAAIGELFRYRITVPSTPHTASIFDVRIADDLTASAADLEFVSVEKVSGPNGWTPVNTGSDTSLLIEDTVNGIDIKKGEQVVLDVTVRLTDSATNVAGLEFTNTASYTYNQLNSDPTTQRSGGSGTTEPMTVVEPLLTLEKSGPLQMAHGTPGTFTLNVHNAGGARAYATTITDLLPSVDNGGMCDEAPANVTAQLFRADGETPLGQPLVAGNHFTVSFDPAPACTMTVAVTNKAGAIGPDERLIITYQASLDADTQAGVALTNIAGATAWHSLDPNYYPAAGRVYTRELTNGTVGVLDHEDAHTVYLFDSAFIFEKTVVNLTSGEDPARVASPGDRLRYSLHIENASDSPVAGISVVDELDRLNELPAFRPGSLTVLSVPDGADASGSDASGGASGTGLLDVSGLNLGGKGDSLLIEFEVELAAVYPNETFVYNQSELRFGGRVVAISDDPNVNDAASPDVDGDEDPTAVRIESAPAFRVQKISAYPDGDPSLLLAGETLRYTITVQNVGTDNAAGVRLVDAVPANTTYVAGSTTLNGVPVSDAAEGGSPLADGIDIYAPENSAPGVLNAAVADNVATIVFDVLTYSDLPDGTVISNQAFVSAQEYGIAEVPSDDPRTPIVDDPTRDVVGNAPLLFAPKIAALEIDEGSPGVVDPGDVLRYTITIYNNGTIPATEVALADLVPANTTYVADSVTLNGLPVGRPDNGVSPLIERIPVGSAAEIPAEGAGVVGPGESAVVQFDLRVDDGVPAGTIITNQATVYSAERPNLLTDGDGNPATGPEPTVVVVGEAQQLAIIKSVTVVDGGPAWPGTTLEYLVTVTNVGAIPAQYVEISDDLAAAGAGYLTYVDGSATLNGLPDGVEVEGALISADYFALYGPLPPQESLTLRFRAVMGEALAEGTRVTNTARATWNEPPQWIEAQASIDVGALPVGGILSGKVFHDVNHDNDPNGDERPLAGWDVVLLRDDQPVRSAVTDEEGNYRMASVEPNLETGEKYALRFSAPGATERTAVMGRTKSKFRDGQQYIDKVVVEEGSNHIDLNMPADPHGTVYDSVARTPVAGATVSLIDVRNGLPIPANCFDDPNQQGQVTVPNGYYKFDINFSDPACPSNTPYKIEIAWPGTEYLSGDSELLPPTSDLKTFPFDVEKCLGTSMDAMPETARFCEVNRSDVPPVLTASPDSSKAGFADAGAEYHVFVRFSEKRLPGSTQLFNNHLPIDPRLGGSVTVSKMTPMLNVTRGQMVPYVIKFRNTFGVDMQDVTIVDRFPAGFRYVAGSARLDGVETEPDVVGRELFWPGLTLVIDQEYEIKLLFAVGAGVTEGEFVNRAQAINSVAQTALSEVAEATVRVVPDPDFDCTDVAGKVFDDLNRNGLQDSGETGIAGVRVVTARGLAAKTDSHGRYHITCAITPNEMRGSNFVLKLDDRTLPSGFRSSSRPVKVQRATRGKSLRVNFGASIHRVVGLDLADAVFEPGSTEIREQWRPRVDVLLRELEKGPAVLRLSYVGDVESEALAERRVNALKDRIAGDWQESERSYELIIEPEIFWRLGAPPKRSKESSQ